MPEMHKHFRLMCSTALHIQSGCGFFAYRGRLWQRHLRAIWYTMLPNARGQMKAQYLIKTDKSVCFFKSYQHIQIPLLMPCRYGTDTADRWERIYGGQKHNPVQTAYSTKSDWHYITYKIVQHFNSRSWLMLNIIFILHIPTKLLNMSFDKTKLFPFKSRGRILVLRAISNKILNDSVQSASFSWDHSFDHGRAWGVHSCSRTSAPVRHSL